MTLAELNRVKYANCLAGRETQQALNRELTGLL